MNEPDEDSLDRRVFRDAAVYKAMQKMNRTTLSLSEAKILLYVYREGVVFGDMDAIRPDFESGFVSGYKVGFSCGRAKK